MCERNRGNALNTFVNVSKDSIVHTKCVNTEEKTSLEKTRMNLYISTGLLPVSWGMTVV